jgi:hypothetical protein
LKYKTRYFLVLGNGFTEFGDVATCSHRFCFSAGCRMEWTYKIRSYNIIR